jgi:uncharacterized membrane protein
MTILLTNLLLAASAFATLLIGGVYFTFSGFIMQSLAQSGEAGMQVMTSINRVILRSVFMPLFFGSTILAVATGLLGLRHLDEPQGWLMLAGGAIFLVGMFGVTAAFNVPLNNRLDANPAAVWNEYLAIWTAWNHVRTVACLVAGTLFLLAMRA